MDIFAQIYTYIFYMKTYFLSSVPCAVKIDGRLVGFCDGFERFISLDPKNRPFVEFIPLNSGMPLSFCLDEGILFRSISGVSVFLGPDFVALRAQISPPALSRPLLIAQDGDVLVFSAGEAEALVDGEILLPLGADFDSCRIERDGELLLLEGKRALCALFEGQVVFQGKAEEFTLSSAEKTLSVLSPLGDFCRRKEQKTWRYDGQWAQIKCERTPRRLPGDEFILPVFLQDLHFGYDAEELLSRDLLPAVEEIKGYIGPYSAVWPQGEGRAAVACREREGVFSVRSFFAEIQEGKVADLKRIY